MQDLSQVANLLKSGKVVAIPTETSYGLACDATNTRALKKIFAIKERPFGNAPPLIVSSLAMALRYGVFSLELKALARKFWPGALTIIVPVKKGSGLSKHAVQDGTVALRVSSNEIARSLTRRLGLPIAATSANLSGKPECYSADCIKKQMRLQPDFILDAGILPKIKPSTIVKEKDGKIVTQRKGSLTI